MLEEEGVWIYSRGQKVELIQPDWVGHCQIVAGAAYVARAKEDTVFALTILFPNPPPEIVGVDQFERFTCGDTLEFPGIDSVTAALENSWRFVYIISQEAEVARFVKAPDMAPTLFRHKDILRVAIRAATVTEVGFKDIEDCSFLAVWVAGFLHGKTARDPFTDEPNPFFCDKTDSSDTTMIMLVRVGKTENPVAAHGARLTSGI
jgi:hypothetical protein